MLIPRDKHLNIKLFACTGALLACANLSAQTSTRGEELSTAYFASDNTLASENNFGVPNTLDFWGFEPGEGFAVGALNGQQGWTTLATATSVPIVSAAAPVTGVQHLRLPFAPGVGVGATTGGFSPSRGAQDPTSVSVMSVDVRITDTGGADYEVVPQSPSQAVVAARVRFTFEGDIRILDDIGGGLAFVDTGADWPVDQVFNLRIILDPVANSLGYFIDNLLIYTSVAGVFAGTSFEQIVILSNNSHNGEVGDFDNLIVDTVSDFIFFDRFE